MTIGEIAFVILFGSLFILAMILLIMEAFPIEKKCKTCCRHLNPDGEIYCGAISKSPSTLKILFCRDKS